MTGKAFSFALLVTALACGGRTEVERSAPAASPAAPAPTPEPAASTPPAVAAPASAPAPAPNDFRHAIAAAAKVIGPAVVSITSTSMVKPVSPLEGTPFEHFFRGAPHAEGGGLRRGIGSGVIIDAAGDVLTNNHVVEGADTVKVVLQDDRELTAKVVGTDAKSDLAVVKIDPGSQRLQPATLGDSGALQVGDWVVASGSPFGLRQTVSAGIVSAVGRANVGISEYEDFIQTDAAINPGNSGGPLVDLDGRVVGINTAIASQSGGNNGVGFAIPISMAKGVVEQLIKNGKVVRGYAGLFIGNVSDDLAASFGYHGHNGALIQDVAPDGPGAKAGLVAGDIIVERDGESVQNASAFRNDIAETAPGTTTKLTVFRDGKQRGFEFKLAALPGSEPEAKKAPSDDHARWGVQIAEITPEMRQHLNIDAATQGAIVVAVKPESPAEEGGLKPGDVIAQVNKQAVHGAPEAQKLLSSAGASVLLRVLREGRGVFIVMTHAAG